MQIMPILLLLFGLIGLMLPAPDAAAEDLACSINADHPLIGEPRWYGLYYEDGKIGHAMTAMTLEPSTSGEAGTGAIAQRFSMTFKLERTEETIEQVKRFDAHPPHRLMSGIFSSADRQISFEARADGLHLHEAEVTRIWPDLDRDLCDEEDMAVHRFLKSDPEIGARIETSDFDVENQVMMAATHDLEAVSTRRILGAEHHFQTLKTSSSSDVFSYTARARFQNGEAVNLFLGPIELRAETEAIAQQPNQGVDLFAEFEKPLNRPLKDLDAIETLTLRASVDGQGVTIEDVVTDSPLQDVDYLDDKTAIIRIGTDPETLEQDEPQKYLRPTSSHPADHPRLKALIDGILASLDQGADAWAKAETILTFVGNYIETVPESPYAYHTTSVFDILDNRTGDCTEHSQLFVTLARAAGLPAREVSGFVYGGDDRAPSLGGHAWVEVMIDDRWIGMDPTWQETELNRSHVQTRNILVPNLTFEVVDIAYR